MSEQLNSRLQNMDDFLRNSLNNHQAELSPNLWGKMKLKLFKNDLSEFIRFKKFKQAFHPNCKSVSLQLKIWSSYAAAACLTIGIVYGSSYYISNIINNKESKTENEIKPANIKSLQPNVDKVKVDQRQSSGTSNLIVIPKDNYKKLEKQEIPVVANNNSSINADNNIEKISNTTTVKENTTPIAYKNFSTLINYIQRLNPQDKIVASEKTEQTNEEADIIPYNSFPLVKDSQENIVQTPIYEIEIPNVITPNGDGFNDVLVIKNLDKCVDNNLLIADRKGNLVYDKNSYQNDWNAQNIPDGTYYYILSYKDKNKNKGVIKGLLTIIR